MGYRLKTIEIAGFRGFNVAQNFVIDRDLVILYAPNGHGKSSFCEAIEWVLYGETSRKLRGVKSIGEREFADSIRNKFYPGNQDAYVSIHLQDGQKNIEVKRTIPPEEGSGRLFLDGTEILDLVSLGISKQVKHSLILQHSIRDFIFSKPSDRLGLISAQLGTGALTNLQLHLQNASRSFKSKPQDVQSALLVREKIKKASTELEGLKPIGDLIDSFDVSSTSIMPILSEIFSKLYGHPLPEAYDAAIKEFDSEIAKVINKAFDCSKLDSDAEVERSFQNISEQISGISSEFVSEKSVIIAHLAIQQLKREHDSITLARLGLPLASADMICPLCGQTITEHHLATMKEKASQEIKEFDLSSFLSKQISAALAVVAATCKLKPYELNDEENKRLKTLLAESDKLITEYELSMSQFNSTMEDFKQTGLKVQQVIGELKEKAPTGNIDGSVVDGIIEGLLVLLKSLAQVKEARKHVIDLYCQIRRLVEGKVVTSAEVIRLSTMKDCLVLREALYLACRDRKVESQVEETVKVVQGFSQRKRNEILSAKSSDMTEWFSMLHPNESVKFKGMKSTATQISLLGDVFGEEVNVSSIFSEAQLNCLGLSFYAVTACSKDNPFDFVIIDDPVQSMDQEHVENFKDRYLRRMLDSGRQVVLLTHMQTLALSVDILFRHLSPLTLEVESYSKEGPKIIESGNVLQRLLEDIRFYMKGDSEYRRTAGGKLRRFLERLLKDLYRAKHSTLPRKYESASWQELRTLIPQCGLNVAEAGRVFESYKFCVNFPHDEPAKEPPTATEIESHIDRLNRIKDVYLHD